MKRVGVASPRKILPLPSSDQWVARHGSDAGATLWGPPARGVGDIPGPVSVGVVRHAHNRPEEQFRHLENNPLDNAEKSDPT